MEAHTSVMNHESLDTDTQVDIVYSANGQSEKNIYFAI